jgi:hypothetical protein
LVEVMVAFVILLIATLPLAYLLDRVSAQTATTRARLEAMQLAERWVAVLSNSNPPLVNGPGGSYVPLGRPETPVDPAQFLIADPTIGGTAFTTRVTYTQQAVSAGDNSNQCASTNSLNAARPGVVSLQVTVSWGVGNYLTDSTNIDYPKPGVQSDGFISIQVTGDTGATDARGYDWSTRVQAIPIVLTPYVAAGTLGSPLPTIYPTADGCAFAQVPIPAYNGAYQVTVGQPVAGTPTGNSIGAPPYFTDPAGQAFGAGNTSHSLVDASETVTVTQQTNISVAFDEGANLAFLYPQSTAVSGGVVCPGTSGVSCIATGSGASGASVAWLSGSTWAQQQTAQISRVSTVACTSGGAYCVAGGYTTSSGSPSGIVVSEPSSGGALTAMNLPSGVSDISNVVCPSQHGCYAIGTQSITGSTAPVLLAGSVGGGQNSWTVVNPPAGVTFTSLSSIACPQTTVCELAGEGRTSGQTVATPGILRLDGDPASASATPGWQPTITDEPLPGGSQLTSIAQVVCVSSTSCFALGVGDATTATDPSVLAGVISSTTATAGSWSFDNLNLPSGSTDQLTDLACTGTTCVAIGSQGLSDPLVLTGALGGGSTADTWSTVAATSLPAGTVAVTGVTCPDATNCLLSADIPSGPAPGTLLAGTLSAGAWTWTPATLPATDGMSFFSGVSCVPNGSVCAAAGATPTGPVLLTSSGGPGGPWSDGTPTGLTGVVPSAVPVSVSITQSAGWSTVVTFGSVDTSAADPVYPRGGGYFVAAADCSAEGALAPAQGIGAAPGADESATVPLGTLPVLVTSAGTPVDAATVSLQASNGAGCPADTYTMPATGPDGLTTMAVPYGTYTITVSQGTTTASGTITVAVDNTTFTSAGGVSTVNPLPTAAQVPL